MDANTVFWSIATSIVGSVIVTLGVLWLIERNRRPDLWFQVEEPAHEMKLFGPDGTVEDVQLLRLYVHNKNTPKRLSWAYNREPAMMCRAWIAFYDQNKLRVYSREMLGRWAETPNPKIAQVTDLNGNVVRYAQNSEELRHSVDIPPGAYTPLDLVVRSKSETTCYGWNNDSLVRYGKNPDWRLKEGQYLVRVTVKTGGKNFDGFFRLINEMEFRLVPENLKINDHMN